MSDLVVIAGNTWHPYPILPMPTLAALRDAVLARSVKRIPKWKFRVDFAKSVRKLSIEIAQLS